MGTMIFDLTVLYFSESENGKRKIFA